MSSGTVTSATNFAWLVQVDEVGVAGSVAVGLGVEVAVGLLVAVEVGGACVDKPVGGMAGWVFVGANWVVSVNFTSGEGGVTVEPGILQAETIMANKIKIERLRSVCSFILFPSFWFNHIITKFMITCHAFYDVDYTIVVPAKILASEVCWIKNPIGGCP